MGKVAVLFAGQGAQYIGMGKSFYDNFSYSKTIYNEAEKILGYDIKEICFQENEKINQTKYTQPAILVTSLAIYHALINEVDIVFDTFLGFSLGEYSALYASGVFSFHDIVYLISKRAMYMEECSIKNPGKMCAVIGIDKRKLLDICDDVSKEYGLVKIANYNSPTQFVIAGLEEAVNKASLEAELQGARKVVKLNVSGGFHTELMSEAAHKIYEEVKRITINKPQKKVIMNATADYLNIENLPELMKKQIESSVYFTDSIKKLIDDGVTTFIEIGPGIILSSLVKKIAKTKKVISINDITDIERVKTWI